MDEIDRFASEEAVWMRIEQFGNQGGAGSPVSDECERALDVFLSGHANASYSIVPFNGPDAVVVCSVFTGDVEPMVDLGIGVRRQADAFVWSRSEADVL